jgi:3-oxoacyl-[acyl-carrier-protein] synthase-1
VLEVVEMGMASSVGGLVGGCAAFRAGIASVSAATGVEVMERGDEEPNAVTVHAHPAARSGFSGVGRLVLLLSEALLDLAERLDLPRVWSESPLWLVLPGSDEGVDRSLFPALEGEAPPEQAARVVVGRAAKAAGLVDAPSRSLAAVTALETGFAAALDAAERVLLERDLPGALIAAVDTVTDPAVLLDEVEEGRVLTEHNPVGYAPGEAAVVALVRRPRAGSASVLAGSASFVDPQESKAAASAPDGRALHRCLRETVARLPRALDPPTLVSDHDGSSRRAHELGMLQLRMKAEKTPLPAAILYPAQGFGRTRAASGAVGLAVAARALARGYARSRSFVVLSTEGQGRRAAFSVTAAPGASR